MRVGRGGEGYCAHQRAHERSWAACADFPDSGHFYRYLTPSAKNYPKNRGQDFGCTKNQPAGQPGADSLDIGQRFGRWSKIPTEQPEKTGKDQAHRSCQRGVLGGGGDEKTYLKKPQQALKNTSSPQTRTGRKPNCRLMPSPPLTQSPP